MTHLGPHDPSEDDGWPMDVATWALDVLPAELEEIGAQRRVSWATPPW